jgi:methionyl-tRNA synthetase
MTDTIKAEININDFAKLDIRIGQITAVDKVPDTDHLYQLEVDFGAIKRQIVSGIADRVSAEYLLGKKCPFILNLEPRTIKGVESQGMILAVGDNNGQFALLHPHAEIDSGATIR